MRNLGHGAQADTEGLLGWLTAYESDRREILNAFAEIEGKSVDEWPKTLVRSLAPEESLFLLSPNKSLRVFFRLEDSGRKTILNVSMQEAIDRLLGRKPQEAT